MHETVMILTVRTLDRAAVAAGNRLRITELGKGFYRAELDFGYLDEQNVPASLSALAPPELSLDPMQTFCLPPNRVVELGQQIAI